jgi:hypothetical protein
MGISPFWVSCGFQQFRIPHGLQDFNAAFIPLVDPAQIYRHAGNLGYRLDKIYIL